MPQLDKHDMAQCIHLSLHVSQAWQSGNLKAVCDLVGKHGVKSAGVWERQGTCDVTVLAVSWHAVVMCEGWL